MDGNSAVFAWRDCEKRWRSCCGFGGGEPGEPVFSITDLLPHLSKDQDARKLGDGVRGEELNIVIGSRPFRDDKASQKVKLAIAKLLFDKYGIMEERFPGGMTCRQYQRLPHGMWGLTAAW